MLLANTDPGKLNIDPGFKELTVTSPKYFRLFQVLCQSFAETFMKIHWTVFPQCHYQARIPPKKSKEILVFNKTTAVKTYHS